MPIRLLHGPGREALSLEEAERGFIPANGEAATLEWRFAPGHAALRLLLADRIGVVFIDEFTLFAGERLVWRRGAARDTLDAGPDTVALDADAYALVRPDAWVAPGLAPEIAATVDRARVTLRWTGDWTGAAAFAALTGLAEVATTRLAAAHREIARLHGMVEERDAALAASNAALAAAREELARREAAQAAQERIILHRQSVRWWLALPFVRLKELLARGTRR